MISVLTCPARGRYLAETIASIERGGGAEYSGPKVIHVDGPADAIPRFEGWEIVGLHSLARAGARDAQALVLQRAAALGVPLLLYFEDDVRICKNAIRAMVEIGVPDELGVVQYCDLRADGAPLEMRAFPGCPRNHPVPDQGFLGCQALAIPLRTLERFASRPMPAWITWHDSDSVISTSVDAYGILASLAEHVGLDSAILGGTYVRLRGAHAWPGEDFDADAVSRTFTLNKLGTRCRAHIGVLHADGLECAGSTAEHGMIVAPPAPY